MNADTRYKLGKWMFIIGMACYVLAGAVLVISSARGDHPPKSTCTSQHVEVRIDNRAVVDEWQCK